MTRSQAYRAPFGPGGDGGIDAAVCERLLSVALSRGGNYADLFFEYRAGGGLSYDEGILKSASRGVSMGLGVRVQRGDATGYAYTEDLTWESMRRAAETAAQIATGGTAVEKVALVDRSIPHRYELPAVSIDVPGADKRAFLERASAAALAYDPLIIKAEASFAEEIREVLIATSDGTMVFDVQPLLRFASAPSPSVTASARRAAPAAEAACPSPISTTAPPRSTPARLLVRPSPCSAPSTPLLAR
ncbi:MAG: DNA gyrase modulator [Polyangiaceae bacterium]